MGEEDDDDDEGVDRYTYTDNFLARNLMWRGILPRTENEEAEDGLYDHSIEWSGMGRIIRSFEIRCAVEDRAGGARESVARERWKVFDRRVLRAGRQ